MYARQASPRFLQLGDAISAHTPHSFYSIGPLIGRSADLAVLRAQLLDPTARMVALTGPAGVGKSRLAAAVFKEVCGSLEGGWFVDLSRLATGTDLAERLAVALFDDDGDRRPAQIQLREGLGDRDLLLVLDHCDDLMKVVVAVGQPLLAECPGLRLLIVGQESPRVYGESRLRLSPLAVPAPGVQLRPGELESVPSVELFLQRARAVRPGFVLREDNREVTAELCRRLDGLPLAIEFAAARLKLLTPGAMLAELDRGIGCLHGTRADTLSRHLSMQAALEQSCLRLGEDERTGFLRLAVFAGEFGITAAATVVRPAHGSVHELLETLVDRNLLRAQDQVNGELGFSMLGTVRAFAISELHRTGEFERVKRSHAAYFLDSAQVAEQELTGADQACWLRQLNHWSSELESAFEFFMARGEGSEAVALAAALRPYWFASGRLRDGARHLERALTVGGLTRHHEAKALDAAGEIGAWLQDPAADEHLLRAREIYQGLHDHRGAAASLHHLGLVGYLRGDSGRSRGWLGEAVIARRAAGDIRGHACALRDLAILERDSGNVLEARRLAETAMRTFRKIQDTRESAITSLTLAEVTADEGELPCAEELCRRALTTFAENQEVTAVARGLEVMAALVSKHGRARERWRRCTTLFSAAAALRADCGCAPPGHVRPVLDDIIERARVRLGGAAFDSAWAEGRVLSAPGAIALALTPVPHDSPIVEGVDIDLASPLTPREHEVAELVAHGLTNREIARRLGIAEWTAVNHLRKVMRKLNCSSRVHVANWVAHRQTAEGAAAAGIPRPRAVAGRSPAGARDSRA